MFYSIENSKEVLESGVTQFTSPFGVFRLLRAVSGGALSPSFAQMTVLKELYKDSDNLPNLIENLFNFYDDITLATSSTHSLYEHATLLANVIDRINRMGFQINLMKSKLCVDLRNTAIEILGMDVSKNCISITKKRRKDVLENITSPGTKRDLQRLIGLLNFLRTLMDSEDLKRLGILSTKLQGNTLKWDKEGENCLAFLKESIRLKPYLIHIPNENCLPLLFSDSSEHTVSGVLYYLPINLLEISPPVLPEIEKSQQLNRHLENYNLTCTPLLKENDKFLDFLVQTYYHYNSSSNPSSDHVKLQIINSLRLLMPQLLGKLEIADNKSGYEQYCKFIIDYDEDQLNLKEHVYGIELLLNGLGNVLNRQIILIILDDEYVMKRNYIKVTNDHTLSPVFISYHNGNFQLLALQKEVDGLKPYSVLKLDDYSAPDLIKIYKNADKSQNLLFGGVYSVSLPASYKHVPIFLKELLSFSCSLSFFSQYIKMSRTFCFVDSSTVYHGLKQIKSKSINKLHRIGLILASTYPMTRVYMIPSALNPSDWFTRNKIDNVINNSENMLMHEFVGKYANEKILCEDQIEEYTEFEPDLMKEKTPIQINLLGPETISQSFKNEATMENVRLKTLQEHQDMANNERFFIKDGYLFHKASNKIFLPPSLWLVFILFYHAKIHHRGITTTYEIIKKQFEIDDVKKFKEKLKNTLSGCVACVTCKACFYKPFKYQSNYGGIIQDSITIDVIESSKQFSPHSQVPIHSVLGIICNVSKHISVYYLSNNNTNEIYNALLSYFSRYRIPSYINCDNASVFRNKKIYSLLNMFNVRLNRSSPYKSRARTFIENAFKQLREASRVFCENHPGTNELMAFLYFIKVHNSLPLPIPGIYITPNFLVNQEDSCHFYKNDYKSVIIGNMEKRLVMVDKKTLEEEALDSEKSFNEAMELIKKKLDLHLKAVNKNRVDHDFNVGDLVVPRNFSRTRKSQAVYLNDPSRIIETNKKSLLVLTSLITGLIYIRHVMDVKKIKIVNPENLPIHSFQKYSLYTKEYLELLVANSKIKAKNLEKNEAIMTRAAAKRYEERIKRNTDLIEHPEDFPEIDEDSDMEENASVEKHVHFEN
jgi:hypothetical protein